MNERMTARSRRHLAWLLALLALSLGACRVFYVFPPVDVSTEARSPTYLLQIRNDTGNDLVIVPSQEHEDAGKLTVVPGDTSDRFPLAVRRLKVGSSLAPQVIEGAYVQTKSTGVGVIRIETDDPADPGCPGCLDCSLSLSLEHPSWFQALELRKSEVDGATTLLVCIDSCAAERTTFRAGPASDECPG